MPATMVQHTALIRSRLIRSRQILAVETSQQTRRRCSKGPRRAFPAKRRNALWPLPRGTKGGLLSAPQWCWFVCSRELSCPFWITLRTDHVFPTNHKTPASRKRQVSIVPTNTYHFRPPSQIPQVESRVVLGSVWTQWRELSWAIVSCRENPMLFLCDSSWDISRTLVTTASDCSR